MGFISIDLDTVGVPNRRPFGDLLVVLPGIMGSTLLDRDGHELWGQGAALWHGVVKGGIGGLAVPPGVGDEHPGDGVRPGTLLPGVHAALGAWSASIGYTALLRHLTDTYELGPDNLITFAYDWRLSNRYNGRRLQRVIEPVLQRWRERPGREQAKVVLVGHSMGGLVARWYAEHEGGDADIRSLITIGTPHRGSVMAVDRLVNGVRVGVWKAKVEVERLTAMARTLPSLHQLLPAYACVERDGRLHTIAEAGGLAGLSSVLVDDGAKFHTQLAGDPGYDVRPIVGIDQPTWSSVRLGGTKADLVRTMLDEDGTAYNRRGDGTVPRFAAYPAGWKDRDPRLHFAAQSHGSLPGYPSVLEQLDGALAGVDVEFRPGGPRIGVTAEDLVPAGQPLQVDVECDDQAMLLRARLVDPVTGKEQAADRLDNLGGGRYRVHLDDVPPGGYEIQVGRPAPIGERLIDVVARPVVVADPDGLTVETGEPT